MYHRKFRLKKVSSYFINMKYLSLFSGIGGFEQAIHQIFPNAECVGYSEIDPYANKIYSSHFPDHQNMGDITEIKDIPYCDLIVGGFPCTNLSSFALLQGDSRGLEGKKSSLFYEMVRLIKLSRGNNPNIKFIMENNYSMKKANRELITNILTNEFGSITPHMINNAQFGVQTRKRIIWTNFPYESPTEYTTVPMTIQEWSNVLEPLECVQGYYLSPKSIKNANTLVHKKTSKKTTRVVQDASNNRYKFINKNVERELSRWDYTSMRSDTMSTKLYTYPVGKSRPITCGGGCNNTLIDRRGDKTERTFVVRYFTPLEMERLFGLPDNYTHVNNISKTRRIKALGNSIPVFIVEYVLQFLT